MNKYVSMTDYYLFAAHAMQGLVARNKPPGIPGWNWTDNDIVEQSFDYADLMAAEAARRAEREDKK